MIFLTSRMESGGCSGERHGCQSRATDAFQLPRNPELAGFEEAVYRRHERHVGHVVVAQEERPRQIHTQSARGIALSRPMLGRAGGALSQSPMYPPPSRVPSIPGVCAVLRGFTLSLLHRGAV